MSPCNCAKFPGRDGVVRMQAHTLDDPRAYKAHYIDLVNIDSSVFQDYQRHPARGEIALAHYLGLLPGIRDGIREANTSEGGGERLTATEWAAKETSFRMGGLSEEDIAILRAAKGPAETGIAALGEFPAGVLEHVAIRRPVYERAAVYDRNELRRLTLTEQQSQAANRGDTLQAEALKDAAELTTAMGISELAVTWEFPIAKVAFGYTREGDQPHETVLRGFRHQSHNDGKCPVYAVASETEALLVTLSAQEVLCFLHARGEIAVAPANETAARRALLELSLIHI